jgi:hypothetical protein
MFRDTVITGKRKKQELIIYALCFAAAFIFNIVGIIIYQTPAIELLTQLHVVFLLSWVFYFLVAVFRLLVWVVKKALTKK